MSSDNAPTTDAPQADPLQQTETRLNRGWLIKMGIFFTVLVAFGFWGLYDATIAYPNRGLADAEYREKEYLEASQRAGLLLRASVENPRNELSTLRARERDIQSRATGGDATTSTLIAQAELAKIQWLTSLGRVGRLDPRHTRFENPTERLQTLSAAWDTRTPPKPLSAFDIPSQWIFVVAGFGGGAWMLVLFTRVSSKKFRWAPETRTLTMPGGRAITPAQIAEVDKRKWDKFFVTLRLDETAGEPREVKLDLLRFSPLEAWILEMEKHSPNYVPPAEEPAETPAEEQSASA